MKKILIRPSLRLNEMYIGLIQIFKEDSPFNLTIGEDQLLELTSEKWKGLCGNI